MSLVALLVTLGATAPAQAVLPQQSGLVDLLDQANVRLIGAQAGYVTGVSVAGAGDVNGDEIDDVIVGAHAASYDANSNAGAAYVIFGRPSLTALDLYLIGRGSLDGFLIEGAARDNDAGSAVATAGDVNDDGLSDVIVGAPGPGAGGSDPGSAYVVYGKAGNGTVQLAGLGAGGMRIDGATASSAAGASVAGAGDVNSDGLADVIVGAPSTSSAAHPGSAYVVYGNPSTQQVSLADVGLPGDTQGIRIDGAAAGDQAGFSVGQVGDVNGDGTAEVIVGADQAEVGDTDNNSGSAYVVYGDPLSNRVNLADVGVPGNTQGIRIDGAASLNYAGNSVAGAGDVDADGRADAIVGAFNAGGNSSGKVYIVYGDPLSNRVNLGDLGAPGNTQGIRIDGAAAGDQAGWSVDKAGDVNGDGRADVIAGANLADNTGSDAGSAYVVYGRTDGTTTIELASIGQAGNTDGFRIDGAAGYDGAGYAVGGAGDINGDERPDVVVGAPFVDNDNGRTNSGAAYGIYGFGTSQVTYNPDSTAGMVNSPIEPLTPAVKRTGTASFGVSPSLPAGLALDPDAGTISGTPTAKQPARTYTVTMTDLADSVSAAISIRVDLPPRNPKIVEALGGY